ncbi:kinesin-like protein KIN-14E [Magnolia sinica]|uniref:kinesin-like protein KIN-14E n=1 Tax=Magnolia sinica TaxID=86752 RepID=UPI002659E7BC|nr:kinesin-like protein KIN-14E [Magnolia sinica]
MDIMCAYLHMVKPVLERHSQYMGPKVIQDLPSSATAELFKILKPDSNKFSFSLKAYMVELYQDTLVNLPLPKNAKHMKLEIKKDQKGMVTVENETVVPISMRI